jgi:hypothetical protein
MLDRPIDPANEPYRDIIEAWRRDLSCMEFGQPLPAEPVSDASPTWISPRPRLLMETSAWAVGMTQQQASAMSFIASYIEEHSYSPSYVEIMRALGLRSKSGVHRIVRGLVDRGRIRMLPHQNRSIEVIKT